MWNIGMLIHCHCDYKMVQPLWRIIWKFLRRLYVELPYDPEILLLVIYPRQLNIDISLQTLIVTLFIVVKYWGKSINL